MEKTKFSILIIQVESSGWPQSASTDVEKRAYIEEFFRAEGIMLEWDQIMSNPGLRQIMKLLLNSVEFLSGN